MFNLRNYGVRVYPHQLVSGIVYKIAAPAGANVPVETDFQIARFRTFIDAPYPGRPNNRNGTFDPPLWHLPDLDLEERSPISFNFSGLETSPRFLFYVRGQIKGKKINKSNARKIRPAFGLKTKKYRQSRRSPILAQG